MQERLMIKVDQEEIINQIEEYLAAGETIAEKRKRVKEVKKIKEELQDLINKTLNEIYKKEMEYRKFS